MKNDTGVLIIIVIVATLFSGCKKGEDDPFISLKSRTNRLVGEWKLVEAEYTETETYDDGEFYNTVYSYDGTKMTETATVYSSGVIYDFTDSYNYSMEYEFSKNGAFEQNESESGSNSVTEGFWAWSHEVPDQNLKNKESVILTFSSGEDFTYSGQTISPNDILVFDRLSSKKFVITIEREELLDYGTISYFGSKTFEKQ